MRTQSAARPAAESLGGGTGERVGRGGRCRRPRKGNDERVDDLNGQGNDQGMGANEGVEGVNADERGVRAYTCFSALLAKGDGREECILITQTNYSAVTRYSYTHLDRSRRARCIDTINFTSTTNLQLKLDLFTTLLRLNYTLINVQSTLQPLNMLSRRLVTLH
ncbi:hypothetical protein Tco_0105765 [Tanacetum coccineum]